MKRYLHTLAQISGAIGALGMLLGIMARLAGGILLQHRWSNYFYPGTAFVVLGIFLLLSVMVDTAEEKR